MNGTLSGYQPMDNIIIGKRVKVGAAITSTCGIFAFFYPEYAAAFTGAAVPLTLVAQVLIAKYWGVTTK